MLPLLYLGRDQGTIIASYYIIILICNLEQSYHEILIQVMLAKLLKVLTLKNL